MGFIEDIQALDRYYEVNRPIHQSMDHIDDRQGKIIYGRTPADLFAQVDTKEEWIPSLRQLMQFRLVALHKLFRAVPEFPKIVQAICTEQKRPANFYDVTSVVRRQFDGYNSQYGVWKVRLTSSSHMVRADDESGNDMVFFHDGNPFKDNEALIKAMQGELSDGGIEYDADAVKNLQRTPPSSRLSYTQYIDAKGGNFTGEGWLNHPIFATACGERVLMERYTFALQVLSLLDFYHQGLHSGWRPGEMKKNFGRPISLGKIGEAFYPPNNSTIGHSALVLSRRLPPDMEI